MSFRTGGDRQKNKDVDFDSDVEVDSLKDAVWRLTTRVYLLEDFIAEKFGEVLGPTGYSPSVSPDNEEKSISSNKRSNVPLPPPKRNKRRRVRRIQQSNECRHIEEDQPNESDDMHNDSLGDVELSDPTTNASESFQEDENSNRDIKKEIFSDASNEVDSDDCGASPFHESRTEDCPVVKKTKGVGEVKSRWAETESSICSPFTSKENSFTDLCIPFFASKRRKKFHLPTKAEYKLFLKVLGSARGETVEKVKPWEKKVIVDNFEVIIEGGQEKIVSKADHKVLLTTDEVEGVFKEAHDDRGHVGRDGTMKYIRDTWYYIPWELLKLYMGVCKVCSEKKPQKKDPSLTTKPQPTL